MSTDGQQPEYSKLLRDSLLFHVLGYLLPIGILYSVLFWPLTVVELCTAVLSSAGAALTTFYGSRLAAVIPHGTRGVDGWRAVPRLAQIPVGILLLIVVIGVCASSQDGAWHWIFPLIAAEMLANPAHIVAVEQESNRKVAAAYLPSAVGMAVAVWGSTGDRELAGMIACSVYALSLAGAVTIFEAELVPADRH